MTRRKGRNTPKRRQRWDILALPLVLALMVLGFVRLSKPAKKEPVQPPAAQTGVQTRGVWLSYIELGQMLTGKGEETYRKNLAKVYENMESLHLSTLVLQVRPFGDALYDSKVYPTSYYITGKQGDPLPFDPLQIAIDMAKQRGMAVEAWVNPFRVQSPISDWPLASTNPAYQHKDWTLTTEAGLTYNPAVPQVRELITQGVRELVQNYDIKGVHFDDYFYPTGSLDYDKHSYLAYQKAGGTLDHKDFRREQVNLLVKEVYAAIKAENPHITFGISPQGNQKNNYEVMCIDTEKWLRETGYIDYIAPQLYWGFEHDKAGFAKKVAEWEALAENSHVQLYIGLGAYRIGREEAGAGSGKKEWQNNTDVLARQMALLKEKDSVHGVLFFSYNSLFREEKDIQAHKEKERENLKKVLTSE